MPQDMSEIKHASHLHREAGESGNTDLHSLNTETVSLNSVFAPPSRTSLLFGLESMPQTWDEVASPDNPIWGTAMGLAESRELVGLSGMRSRRPSLSCPLLLWRRRVR